ncbi:MAG: hypothetical protein AB8H79_00680 [Myxococcota bacterium]
MVQLGMVFGLFWVPSTAMAADALEAVDGSQRAVQPFEWFDAWAHVVRFDVAPGRLRDTNLGASGLAVQFEWWPTPSLSYTARTWMQAISVTPPFDGAEPVNRETTGFQFGIQAATPGAVKALAGAGVGFAAVNGLMPPSDRWLQRPVPLAGVVEAHGGVVVMAHPVTLHVLGWVHVYTEGSPVFSVSIGGGFAVRPKRPDLDGGGAASQDVTSVGRRDK